ncbi:hypothetical protein LCGC14_1118640 [marine sediment metagenome]|uniref:Uncharacterized protein n=1 Tax=marine sediment metagenome TaxID=412755 RepID=A0A0F9PMU0_9ZZZZ
MDELHERSLVLDRREESLKEQEGACRARSKWLDGRENTLDKLAMGQADIARENEAQRNKAMQELAFSGNKVAEARLKETAAAEAIDALSSERGEMETKIKGLENKVVKLEAQVEDLQAKYDKERAKRSETSELLREAIAG